MIGDGEADGPAADNTPGGQGDGEEENVEQGGDRSSMDVSWEGGEKRTDRREKGRRIGGRRKNSFISTILWIPDPTPPTPRLRGPSFSVGNLSGVNAISVFEEIRMQ